MKVNYMGFDIECTVDEFVDLLEKTNKVKEYKITYNSTPYVSPTTVPHPWDWNKITCTSDRSTTLAGAFIDYGDFSKKFTDKLNSIGVTVI